MSRSCKPHKFKILFTSKINTNVYLLFSNLDIGQEITGQEAVHFILQLGGRLVGALDRFRRIVQVPLGRLQQFVGGVQFFVGRLVCALHELVEIVVQREIRLDCEFTGTADIRAEIS